MVFSDLDFILLFLPITILLFVLARRTKLEYAPFAVLLVASIAFYSLWNTDDLLLLLGLTVVNFTVAEVLPKNDRQRTTLLAAGIAFNLLVLAYYKYSGFLLDNLAFLSNVTDVAVLRRSEDRPLPLGISFYTFTQIAYLIDCATRHVAAQKTSYPRYLLFLTTFPHLLAGPIVHYRDLAPQFQHMHRFLLGSRQAFGLMLFAVGLGKKVLIADPLSPLVATTFSQPELLSMAQAWAGMFAYTFQLYFDFSGYSDMAIGIAAMFGLRLPRNFDRPYLSRSPREFWRRWHITLSRFLRDYLYIPMGGNHGMAISVGLRALITMLLGGLWHGAAWTFVVWGAYHGALLIIQRLWQNTPWRIPPTAAWAMTFLAVACGWVFFRSPSMGDAGMFFLALIGANSPTASIALQIPLQLYLAAVLVLAWNERLPVIGRWAPAGAIAAGALIFLSASAGGEISEFLYFRF
jgi:alginate O-acetyltransferase complex protein AlgI